MEGSLKDKRPQRQSFLFQRHRPDYLQFLNLRRIIRGIVKYSVAERGQLASDSALSKTMHPAVVD